MLYSLGIYNSQISGEILNLSPFRLNYRPLRVSPALWHRNSKERLSERMIVYLTEPSIIKNHFNYSI